MEMDIDASPSRARKRSADTMSPPSPPSPAPRILHRYHNRKRNIAATIWGPDIPRTPRSSTSTTSTPAPPQRFNIYKALLRHPNLFFQFCIRLPYPSIINLYAIDKEFHYRLNKYSVSLIHDYARYHAPLASHIFSWVLHPDVCISDPMLRPMDGRSWLARDVPGFRWVGLVLWREKAVRSILTHLSLEGHILPAQTESTLYKFWALMEISSSAVRAAFLADTSIWADVDIAVFHLLLVKLDMRFSLPAGNGSCALSHLLLTQRSLSYLRSLLAGKASLDYDDAADIAVRTYHMIDLDLDTHAWLADAFEHLPASYWGVSMREGWEKGGERMDDVGEMVVGEGVRRGLGVEGMFLDFVMYGWGVGEGGGDGGVVRRWRGDGKGVKRGAWPEGMVGERVVGELDGLLLGEEDGEGMDLSD